MLRRSCLAGILVLLGGVPLAAQEEPSVVFTEILDVRVVNLEVVVTDRQGNRLTGLGAADFRLLVEGEEVEIAYFTEIRGGVSVAAEPEATPVASVPALAAGEPVGTSYLVFIDEYFTLRVDRDRVVRALMEELPRLGPNDRMAVVAYTGDGVEMLTSWNRPPAIERSLRQALERPTRGLERMAERRQAATAGSSAILPLDDLSRLGRTTLQLGERAYLDRLVRQLEQASLAAASAMRGFAAPPGRKVMLLLSGGWPWVPSEFLFGESDRLILEQTRSSGDLYGVLIDTANRLGYTIYGVEVPSLLAAELPPGDASVSVPQGGSASVGQAIRRGEIRSSLVRISESTGGRAVLGARRAAGLELAVEDTRSYYWLGFRPDWQHDDRPRSIKVEVKRPGLRVRSRSSYLDLSRDQEVAMMVESALLFGSAPTGHRLGIRLGEVRSVRRLAVHVPLEIAIPVDALAILPAGDRWIAELELRIAARDDRGRSTDVPVIPIRLTLYEAPRRGQFVRYETTLELRRLAHRLVVAIYDPKIGTVLTATTEFTP